MDFSQHFNTLGRTPQAIAALIAELTIDQLQYTPPSGNWSIGFVLCHLADEEVDDFRMRLRLTLEHPGKPWPAIDPPSWAQSRNYQAQDPLSALARFTTERRHSIEWLRSVSTADWRQAYRHPKFGPIPAGELLASWAAHDLLHIRQITKRMYELTQIAAGEFSIRYAGEWTA